MTMNAQTFADYLKSDSIVKGHMNLRSLFAEQWVWAMLRTDFPNCPEHMQFSDVTSLADEIRSTVLSSDLEDQYGVCAILNCLETPAEIQAQLVDGDAEISDEMRMTFSRMLGLEDGDVSTGDLLEASEEELAEKGLTLRETSSLEMFRDDEDEDDEDDWDDEDEDDEDDEDEVEEKDWETDEDGVAHIIPAPKEIYVSGEHDENGYGKPKYDNEHNCFMAYEGCESDDVTEVFDSTVNYLGASMTGKMKHEGTYVEYHIRKKWGTMDVTDNFALSYPLHLSLAVGIYVMNEMQINPKLSDVVNTLKALVDAVDRKSYCEDGTKYSPVMIERAIAAFSKL